MTIIEATNKLAEYFLENEYVELSKDFLKIVTLSETDADKAAVTIALEELEKQKFVFKKEIDKKEYWILAKPMMMQYQDIQISLMTALGISNIINQFVEKEEDKANPLRITEQDITNLAIIAKNACQKSQTES